MFESIYLLITQNLLPFLKLPFAIVIFLIAFLISFFNVLAYKFLIDHEKMKEYKKESKKIQERIRELQKKDPKKAEEEMKKSLEFVNKQMSMSMKPMLVSFLIVILFFPWISSISNVTVKLNDDMTGYFVVDKFVSEKKNFTIKVNNSKVYFDLDNNGFWDVKLKEGDIFDYYGRWKIEKIDEEKKIVKFSGNVKTPIPVPFFSSGFGWFLWYFISSTIIFYILRKIFGIDY